MTTPAKNMYKIITGGKTIAKATTANIINDNPNLFICTILPINTT